MKRQAPRTLPRSKRPDPPKGPAVRILSRPWVICLAIVAAVLCVTIDDRIFGRIPDGVQMLRTAVAMTETGSIGIGRGATKSTLRPEGDAVSKYGLGTSLAQVPAAALAPLVEKALGFGRSQPLFLFAPLLAVLLAAAAAARAATILGAGPRGAVMAVLLSSLGSPLAAYAGMEMSEPFQAACLAVAFAASLEAASLQSLPLAGLAGAAAAFGILTKASLLAVAPFALLPLLAASRRVRLVSAAALGALPPLVLWVWSDIVRFGRPLGGYVGEGFTHSPLDGAWRLLVGPNRGLLFFFPACFVALWATVRLVREKSSRERQLGALGAVLAFGALFAIAATWWAWHGVVGWGPRLLVPAVPLLAALAAVALEAWPRRLGTGFVVLSIALNVPPLLQPSTPVDLYVIRSAKAVIDQEMARQLPAEMLEKRADGATLMWADQVLATVPQAAPHLVFPWFRHANAADPPEEAARRLSSPPWLSTRPDLTSDPLVKRAETLRKVIPPSGVGFLGRAFFRRPDERGYETTYLSALGDQVMRAHQRGDLERGLSLALKLDGFGSTPLSTAYLVESYRRMGRMETAAALLSAQPASQRRFPRVAAAAALLERDLGDETAARASLEWAARGLPGTPAERALSEPVGAWPSDLYVLTGASLPVEPGPAAGTIPRRPGQ